MDQSAFDIKLDMKLVKLSSYVDRMEKNTMLYTSYAFCGKVKDAPLFMGGMAFYLLISDYINFTYFYQISKKDKKHPVYFLKL